MTERTVVCTDAVDSTRLTEQLGAETASAYWTEHDRIVRRLLRERGGREIDKSDGFLLSFDDVGAAIAFTFELHHAFAALRPPLACRAGIDHGPLIVRPNSAEDTGAGAKPFEMDGIAKAVAARAMALARGGQTLLTAAAASRAGGGRWRLQSHGHWRLKGLAEPLELFEAGEPGAAFLPPADSAKAYRVVAADGGWRAVAQLPQALPAERDDFVGRADALAGLAARFDGGARLVSVLGPGGIGKTRLALRHARDWLGDFPGGAWFCDLASAHGVDGIVHAVALGLDVRLARADPVDEIGNALAARGACLVILDNFEQVVRHAEATVGRWLQRAPEARFVVTSREVLGIAGEQALQLAPLAADEARRLFDLRARAADDRYAAGAGDDAVLAALVERLDRLPLAIELAAARVRVLAPRQILERMDERFTLLRASGRRHDRQATLRATIDTSWDLLSAPEQAALARLSIFEGGFTLAAAEAVAGAEAIDLVQSLVEKSLVRHVGTDRFDLLRTVQDYAAERLRAEGDAAVDAARRCHWRLYAALDEDEATRDRCVDIDNLVAACRRAAAAGDHDAAVRALDGAWAALRLTGPFRAGVELAEAVERGTALASPQQAAVDAVMGSALSLTGDVAGAGARYDAGLARARDAGDSALTVRLLRLSADLEGGLGHWANAQARLDEAGAIADDPRSRQAVLAGRGALALRQGRLAEARTHCEQAVELARAAGDRRWLGGLLGNLGAIALLEGRFEDAGAHYALALESVRQAGDRQWEGNARCNLGLLRHRLGDHRGAWSELERALALARSIGYRRLEATTLCNLGLVAAALGDANAAIASHEEAVRVAAELGDARLEGEFGGYLGVALAAPGRDDAARRCFERALGRLPPDDASARGRLHAQRALASARLGDAGGHRAALDAAETLLAPLGLAANSDEMLALSAARAAGISSPR